MGECMEMQQKWSTEVLRSIVGDAHHYEEPEDRWAFGFNHAEQAGCTLAQRQRPDFGQEKVKRVEGERVDETEFNNGCIMTDEHQDEHTESTTQVLRHGR